MHALTSEQITKAAIEKEKEYFRGKDDDGFNYEDAFMDGARYAEEETPKFMVRYLVFGNDESSEPGSDGKILGRSLTLDGACNIMWQLEEYKKAFDMTVYDVELNKLFQPNADGAYYWDDVPMKQLL